MADLGEINVEVKSEGADDAGGRAQDAAEGGGGGGQGQPDTLGTAIRGGFVGGLLSQALGPVIDILDPILKILQAFLAPVAVVLMRLLTPVLRGLIKALPVWMRFMDGVGAIIGVLAQVPGILFRLLTDLGSWFASLAGDIWEKIKPLAQMIWDKFKNTFPGLASAIERLIARSGARDTGPLLRNPFDLPDPENRTRPTTPWGRMEAGQEPIINIDVQGGLEQFISRITRNGRFDFP